jgi:hypothetical protein
MAIKGRPSQGKNVEPIVFINYLSVGTDRAMNQGESDKEARRYGWKDDS